MGEMVEAARAEVAAADSAAADAAPPMAPAHDLLKMAHDAAERWRGRYVEELQLRQDGGEPLPVAFSLKRQQEIDRQALDALAACVAPSEGAPPPEEVDAAIGADLGWTARQLLGLRLAWKDRPAHEPAPETVMAGWRTIAYSRDEADLQSPTLFFLFFASKLLQRKERDDLEADPFADPFLRLLKDLPNPYPFLTGGAHRESVSPYKGYLRDYIYLSRRTEQEDAIAALDDEATRARLDRAMLFLALVSTKTEDLRVGAEADLWDPISRDARGEARSVDAPTIVRGRFELYFRSDEPLRLAYAHAFEKITTRNQLYTLDGLSGLNRMTARIRRDGRGGTT